MKPIHVPHALLGVLALCAPIGAQTAAQKPEADGGRPSVPPLDARGEFESIQDYLLARYDADRDGRITQSEYKRSAEAFKRLDKDGDGVLSAEDFASSSRGESRGSGGMGSRVAMLFVAWYFQGDEDASKLPLAELERSLELYDTDADGTISKAELACGIPERSKLGLKPSAMMESMLEGEDPYESLLASADGDENGALARAEVIAFFKAQDSNNDGVWDLSGFSGSPRGGGAGNRPMTGPAEGTLAPDFTLTTLQGDGEVTLSEFRGKKPVALIFGSFT